MHIYIYIYMHTYMNLFIHMYICIQNRLIISHENKSAEFWGGKYLVDFWDLFLFWEKFSGLLRNFTANPFAPPLLICQHFFSPPPCPPPAKRLLRLAQKISVWVKWCVGVLWQGINACVRCVWQVSIRNRNSVWQLAGDNLLVCDSYSQSHLGWHFRKLFQSSKLKARTSLFTETLQKRRSSFELWALKQHSKMSPQVG